MDGQVKGAVVHSILAVDCGTLYTRTVLIDIIDDEYRFVGSSVAPTTTELPFGDITIGVNSAIAELEAATGRQFVIDGRIITPQRSDGHGIDLLVASCSAAPALRLVVAGLTSEYSANVAAGAAESTYTDVLESISLDEQPPRDPDSTEAPVVPEGWWIDTRAEKLLAIAPDAVLVAGGVENGPVAPLLQIGNLLLRTFAEQKQLAKPAYQGNNDANARLPLMLFAGNSAALEELQQLIGANAEIVTLPNIQPELGRLDAGPLQRALREQYEKRQLPGLPGYDALSTWSRSEITPTLHAVELISRFISAQYNRDVMVADVGAASVGLMFASSRANGQHAAVIKGDNGLAQGLANLLAQVGPEAVLRWLPFPFTADELSNWALNKVVRPLTLPYTARDLAIEHAFAREALRCAMDDMRTRTGMADFGYDLLVGTGGLLANAPRNAQAALIMLDGLEPSGEGVGSFELALDSTLLMPALGALAQVHPAATAYVFDRDCLFMLGPCIVPLGAPPAVEGATSAITPGAGKAQIAVEITVDYVGGESQKFEIPYGSIQVIPLRPEQRASLRVKPSATFRIGNDDLGKLVQTRAGEEVKGGLLGLIVDARGRPLVLPHDDDERIAKLLEWGRALRAYSPRENFGMPPRPLAPAAPAQAPAQPAAQPAQPQQVAQPVAQARPTPQPVPQPVAQPTPQPTPAPQPAAQPRPAPQPSAQPTAQTIARPPLQRDAQQAPTQPAQRAPVTPNNLSAALQAAEETDNVPAASGATGKKRQTAPLLWPTGAPPEAADVEQNNNAAYSPPHLASGRRPQTNSLTMPDEE